MNKVILIGRLTKEPEIRSTIGENPVKFGRYSLAVDRRIKKENEASADFISCTVFGKGAEFAEKYLHKGMKIAAVGRIQTGSYDKDGKRIYTTDVIVEDQEFVESKSSSENTGDENSFMDVNEEGLPFS